MKQEYEVRLDLFEGPLDLLLYLVNRAEVSIVEIKVAEIAAQYLAYLDVMRDLNIDVAGEYLNMAATLVRLKSRELLPDSPQEDLDMGADSIYSREQLVAALLEYKKFKEAAGALKSYEAKNYGTHSRGRMEPVEELDVPALGNEEVTVGDVSIFDLISAFKSILERAVPDSPNHIVEIENCRVDDRIEHILAILSDLEGGGVREARFSELFADSKAKIVLVVTFMAILELVKMGQINFRQEEAFGEIFVMKGEGVRK